MLAKNLLKGRMPSRPSSWFTRPCPNFGAKKTVGRDEGGRRRERKDGGKTHENGEDVPDGGEGDDDGDGPTGRLSEHAGEELGSD